MDAKGKILKDKIMAKPWAQKVMAKFAKKDKHERRASMSEEHEDPSPQNTQEEVKNEKPLMEEWIIN